MIPFYDNKLLEPAEDGWVDVERIYCFDWDAFDETLMERLRAIFVALPQSRKHDAHDCHWWYSDREDIENGYLTAGVEPPGLQVFGSLPLATWREWDRAFQAQAVGFPVRHMR
jgi:hypothetical protein